VNVCVHKFTKLFRITPIARSQELKISNGPSPTIQIETISKILLRTDGHSVGQDILCLSVT
jgi:hypothetical protein